MPLVVPYLLPRSQRGKHALFDQEPMETDPDSLRVPQLPPQPEVIPAFGQAIASGVLTLKRRAEGFAHSFVGRAAISDPIPDPKRLRLAETPQMPRITVSKETMETSAFEPGEVFPGKNSSTMDGILIQDFGTEVTFDNIDHPFDSRGNFSDLYLGTHRTAGKVALKRLRPRGARDGDVATLDSHTFKEMEIWMKLRHERILRCLGAFTHNGHLYFVSPFMKNGNLLDWLRTGNHTGMDRLRLISELADALVYLHTSGIVHGDVKAINVLLSDECHVQLCDFGLTKLAGSQTSTALRGAGSFRWQSPELWNYNTKTFKSDVYAFGMTIVEVLTGQQPFPNMIADSAVMMAILTHGERPTLSSYKSLPYARGWKVAECCWHLDPDKRVSMETASALLKEL